MKNTAFNTMITQNDSAKNFAQKILAEIMNFRRISKSGELCADLDCHKCSLPHLAKIITAVQANTPITFVLPAFPGKSPNLEKVLGPLPDHAEQLALSFLGALCQRIKKYYAPGIKIILCSDGRVFSDLIGIKEDHVTAYQVALNNLIKNLSLADLSTFNLDDIYTALNFEQMRDALMICYGSSLDFLKHKIQKGTQASANLDEQDANRMYRGITRFLFEDALYPGQTKSRTTIQKESRTKAYEVINRSNAWSELIAEHFPHAIRLSIHPQTCGSKKLGIRLIGNEHWMTPWHGVAVETAQGYVLLKRSEAEALGAQLIYAMDGRPSHYQLNLEKK